MKRKVKKMNKVNHSLITVEPYVEKIADIRYQGAIENYINNANGLGASVSFTGPLPRQLFNDRPSPFSKENGGPIFDRSSFLFLHAQELAKLLISYKKKDGSLSSIFFEEFNMAFEEAKKNYKISKKPPFDYLSIQIYPPDWWHNFCDKGNPSNFIEEFSYRSKFQSIETKKLMYFCDKTLYTVYSNHLQLFLYKKQKEIENFYKEKGFPRIIVYFGIPTLEDYIGEYLEEFENTVIFDSAIPIEKINSLPIYNRDGSEYQ